MKKLALLSLLLVLITGCGNTELTRDKATKLLKSQTPDETIEKLVQNINDQDVLAVKGFLNWRTVKGNLYTGGSYRVDFILNDNAKEYLINETGKDRTKKYTFNLGTIQFGEVTGILQKPESNEAIVEYTVIHTANEFGKKLFWSEDKVETKKVKFKRYDDGWRVTIKR